MPEKSNLCKIYYDVQGFQFEGNKKRICKNNEIKKLAKEMLKHNKRLGFDREVMSRDLNEDINAWVYLKNIGIGVKTNRKKW